MCVRVRMYICACVMCVRVLRVFCFRLCVLVSVCPLCFKKIIPVYYTTVTFYLILHFE